MKTQKQDNGAGKPTSDKKSSVDNILEQMATEYSIQSENIQQTLLNTAFKGARKDNSFSQSEVNSILSIANKYKLNPFIREIYAFENKHGTIIPIISVDGWIKILNRDQNLDGFELVYSDNMVEMGKSKPCWEWIEIVIHLKNRGYPVVIREYLDECYNGNKGWTSPWDTHTKRMMRHKIISQGTRVALGVNDAYEADEVDRIDESIKNETPVEVKKPATINDTPETENKVAVVNDDVSEKIRKSAASTGAPAPMKAKEVIDDMKKNTQPEPEAKEDNKELEQTDIFDKKAEPPADNGDELPPIF